MLHFFKVSQRKGTGMKKWTGGILIIGLALILVIKYSLVERPTQKQSAYEFFHPQAPKDANIGSGSDNNSVQIESKQPQDAEERPHLVKVKGLDNLMNLSNISKEDSKALLVWAQMRTLLSRSDSLPETAQGVKEASVAWKELLSIIEERRISKIDFQEDKDCPYSVRGFNRTALVGASILDIPCGLVEDSSISIIGVPDGQQGSFQIELIGSKMAEESNPPIVLHYNVFLPGDNFTKEPVIIQNSWTNEDGWGKEERCLSRGSNNIPKVDGLVKCNEQIVRSSMEEKLNASHLSSDNKSTNVSDVSSYSSENFPFSEGSPFTATVWAGAEGFHMTVNGRHETSFAYREKLEPWLITGVRAQGGLKVISALAKSLPVSEDLDLVVDVEHLKAPPIAKKRLVMLIGVFSSGNNFERRMALRRSWMQYEAVRSGEVAVRFFIGLHKNRQVNWELWREAQAYGDVQLMPFVDYYSLLTIKTIAISILGTKILPAKYIMKTDDDAFLRIDEVLSNLKTKVPNGLLYGRISFESTPHRDKDNKWYISTEEWPHAQYPPWAHGPGYVISRDIAKFIVQGHNERKLKLFKLEDVAMGIWIQQYEQQGHKIQYQSDDRFNNAGCESNYILAHYQNPRMVLCLWEKLQKEHEANCCD